MRYDGRAGSSTEDGDQCLVSFEPAILVRGATVTAYRDLSVPLPGVDQRADGLTPGWEDWDGDGKPGITQRVTGAIFGRIFELSRSSARAYGHVPRDTGSFLLTHQWTHERVTLGYDGAPLLVYTGQLDPDDSQQLVELTRLTEDQAVGSDDARCAAVRELAATLTPHASH